MGGFYIGKCPRIVPFLENNGPRSLAGPRSIFQGMERYSDILLYVRLFYMVSQALKYPEIGPGHRVVFKLLSAQNSYSDKVVSK